MQDNHIKSIENEILECRRNIDALCKILKLIGVPKKRWLKNVMIQTYLNRIDAFEKKIQELKEESRKCN